MEKDIQTKKPKWKVIRKLDDVTEVEAPEKARKEFLGYVEEAKSFFEEIIGRKINGKPEIHFFLEESFPFQQSNEICIPVSIVDYEKKQKRYTVCHEYLHWVIRYAFKELENNFKNSKLTNPFWRSLIERNETVFIVEGIANLSGAILISEKDEEVLKNLLEIEGFTSIPNFQSSINLVVEGVYIGLNKGSTGINEVVRSCKFLSYYFPHYYMGLMMIIFAFEVYKKEGKSAKQLLRDLILSPEDTIEKAARKIRNDNNKDKELLKATLSDLTFDKGFKPRE